MKLEFSLDERWRRAKRREWRRVGSGGLYLGCGACLAFGLMFVLIGFSMFVSRAIPDHRQAIVTFLIGMSVLIAIVTGFNGLLRWAQGRRSWRETEFDLSTMSDSEKAKADQSVFGESALLEILDDGIAVDFGGKTERYVAKWEQLGGVKDRCSTLLIYDHQGGLYLVIPKGSVIEGNCSEFANELLPRLAGKAAAPHIGRYVFCFLCAFGLYVLLGLLLNLFVGRSSFFSIDRIAVVMWIAASIMLLRDLAGRLGGGRVLLVVTKSDFRFWLLSAGFLIALVLGYGFDDSGFQLGQQWMELAAAVLGLAALAWFSRDRCRLRENGIHSSSFDKWADIAGYEWTPDGTHVVLRFWHWRPPRSCAVFAVSAEQKEQVEQILRENISSNRRPLMLPWRRKLVAGVRVAVVAAVVTTVWIFAFTARPNRVMQAHDDAVRAVAISESGEFVASTAGKGGVSIWDSEDQLHASLKTAPADPVTLQFAPDEKSIAIGCNNGQVQLWDVQSATLITKWQAADQTITRTDFSPDGKKLLTSTMTRTDAAALWDLASVRIGKANNQELIGYDAMYSPDGERLAVASWPANEPVATIQIIDAASGKQIADMGGYYELPLVFGVGTRQILVGGVDRKLIVRDSLGFARETGYQNATRHNAAFTVRSETFAIATPYGVRVLKSPPDNSDLRLPTDAAVSCVAISPDGKTIAAGCEDGSIWFWSNSD